MQLMLMRARFDRMRVRVRVRARVYIVSGRNFRSLSRNSYIAVAVARAARTHARTLGRSDAPTHAHCRRAEVARSRNFSPERYLSIYRGIVSMHFAPLSIFMCLVIGKYVMSSGNEHHCTGRFLVCVQQRQRSPRLPRLSYSQIKPMRLDQWRWQRQRRRRRLLWRSTGNLIAIARPIR